MRRNIFFSENAAGRLLHFFSAVNSELSCCFNGFERMSSKKQAYILLTFLDFFVYIVAFLHNCS